MRLSGVPNDLVERPVERPGHGQDILAVPAAELTATVPFAVLLAVSIVNGVRWFDKLNTVAFKKSASKWIRDGADEDEVLRRRRSVVEMGAAEALFAAGVIADLHMPPVNIDGAPMVPGTNYDAHVHVYGVPAPAEATFDVGNDAMLSPGQEHNAPLGMDDNRFGGGGMGGGMGGGGFGSSF